MNEQDLADYQAYLDGSYKPPAGIALPTAAPTPSPSMPSVSDQDMADYQAYLAGTYKPPIPVELPGVSAEPVKAPQSGALLASNTLMAPLQGAGFNFGDEAVAGAQTAIEGTTNVLGDYLVNPIRGIAGYEPISWDRGKGYDANLESVRGDYKQYQAEHPKEALVSELIGAVAMPWSGAMTALKGTEGVQALSKLPAFEQIAKVASKAPVTAKVAQGALSGATQAGLYGFGGGEGDIGDRLESSADMAKWGAAIGGAVPAIGGTVKGVSNFVKDRGIGGQKSAVGITAAMENQSAKGPLGQSVLKATGQTPISEAFDRVKNMGVFKGGVNVAPDKLYHKISDKADEVHDALIKTLKLADEKIDTKIYPKINFGDLQKKIESNFSLQQKADATKHLAKQVKNFESEFDGSLRSLEKMKRDLYKTSYGAAATGSTKVQVDRLLANQIKTTIENTVDNLAKKGTIDASYAGRVRELNKDLGALISLEQPALRQLSAYEAGDFGKDIISKIKTSGGAGVGILGGLLTGNPILGLTAGGLMIAKDTPSAWYALNKAVSGAGGLGAKAGESISNLPLSTVGPMLYSPSQPSEDPLSFANGEKSPEIYQDQQVSAFRNQAPLAMAEDMPAALPEEQEKLPTKSSSESSPFKDIAVKLSTKQDVNKFVAQQPKLIQAMIMQESSRNIHARSPKGAIGLMQLMPGTAKDLGVDPYDPIQNVEGGTRYIKQMFKQFGDPYLAMAAYNAGPGTVQQAIRQAGTRDWNVVQRFLRPETRQYIPGILEKLSKLETA